MDGPPGSLEGSFLDITTRRSSRESSPTGLIGFDAEIVSRIVRPELLRLLKRGTNTSANDDSAEFALAA